MTNRIDGDLRVTGDLVVGGSKPAYGRSDLTLDQAKPYALDLTSARVWDAVRDLLPAAAANDDLGLVTGTLGTDAPTLQAGDLKAAGATTRYCVLMRELPPEYVDGESVTLRISGGMKTTVSDGTATVDAQVYALDREGGVSADLCATAAQSINNLVFADLDFTITPTALSAGDVLMIRLAIAVDDSSTVTAVIGTVAAAELLLDIKG